MDDKTIVAKARVQFGLRWKLTLPLIFLAVLLGGAALLQSAKAGVDSAQARLHRQLADSGQQALDGVVRAEEGLLEAQRLIANTDGVIPATALGDAERLRSLVLPVVINADVDLVALLDTEGASVLAVRAHPGASPGTYDTLRGEAYYADWPFVRQALAPDGGEGAGKQAGLQAVRFEDEPAYVFMIGAPLKDPAGRVVGAVVTGVYLENLVARLARESGANVSAYDLTSGDLLETTLESADPASLALQREQIAGALFPDQVREPSRVLTVAGAAYREILLPLTARGGSDLLGFLGFSLLDLGAAEGGAAFFVTGLPPAAFGIAAMGIVLALLLGLLVSDPVSRKLRALTATMDGVAAGNLDAPLPDGGHDELGELVQAVHRALATLRDGKPAGIPARVRPAPWALNGSSPGAAELAPAEACAARATVLYADFAGFRLFMEAAEGGSREAIEDILKKLAAVIEAHGGDVARMEWDHCLAVFGLTPRPLPAPVGALQAVHAGMAVLEFIEGASLRRMLEGQGGFSAGVGLATGMVGRAPLPFNGRSGSGLIGEATEQAQRVAELTRRLDSGGLLLPEATLQTLGAARSQFQFEEHGQLALPGSARSTAIYAARERAAPLIEYQAMERSPL